jgi:hypothetical protein
MRISLFLILVFCFSAVAYAQNEKTESLTVSTYFPAPYGVYRQLEVHRSVKFQPLNLTVSLTPAPQAGELVYSEDDKFYYHNGAGWTPLAGGSGGGALLELSCSWRSDYRDGPGNGDGTQCGIDGLSCCNPPSCPAGWTPEITYPVVDSVSCGTVNCYWTAPGYDHPPAKGRVVRVCSKNQSAASSGTLISLSCPWHSDGNNWTDPGSGDGAQCGANGLSCCTPPACPGGWTSKTTYPEMISSSCANGNCDWRSKAEGGQQTTHPGAGGRVVRICEKN